MKALVIGNRGQLATDLRETFPTGGGSLVAASRDEADVTDRDRIRRLFDRHRPDVVVSPAAYHEVDRCEERADLAFMVNAAGAWIVAQEAARVGARLVWYSTDYVFDGERSDPYPEDAPVRPLSVYATSKVAGERLVHLASGHHLVVRTAALFGRAGTSAKGGNFIETMIGLARAGKTIRVVSDQVNAPTHTLDVARCTWELVRRGASGVAHITSRGHCSWYDFTCRILELTGLATTVVPLTSREYGAAATRPLWSVLAHRALEAHGLAPMPRWEDALAEYLALKGHIPAPEPGPEPGSTPPTGA